MLLSAVAGNQNGKEGEGERGGGGGGGGSHALDVESPTCAHRLIASPTEMFPLCFDCPTPWKHTKRISGTAVLGLCVRTTALRYNVQIEYISLLASDEPVPPLTPTTPDT